MMLFLHSTRCPGGAQFEAAYLADELTRCCRGMHALRAHGVDGRLRIQSLGLWGAGGFSGAQPGLRLLLVWIAAHLADAQIQVALPCNSGDPDARYFRALLAEVHAQPLTAVWALMTSEVAAKNRRLWSEVPAFASFVIKTLRSGCGDCNASALKTGAKRMRAPESDAKEGRHEDVGAHVSQRDRGDTCE